MLQGFRCRLRAVRAAPLLIAVAALSLASGAVAATKGKPRLPDWSRVWNPAERNIFDPQALPPVNKGEEGYLPDTSYAREYPPYTADYNARYEATLKRTAQGFGTDPTGRCLPPGFPRMMNTPFPLEFIIEPGRTTILFEAWGQTRRIWTDGRPHPKDLDPTYSGHSIGHWDGDTLAVDTVGMREDTNFDVTGAPHSDAIHVMERLRRRNAGTIEDRITVEDPKAFTRPWTVTRTYSRKPGWQIAEFVCLENQRNPPNPDGATGTVLQTGPAR
jgi:hypothetical protein